RIGALVEIAATNTRLVGGHDDRPLHLIGPETSEFENSGDEFELVRPVHVAVVHIDHPIPVEKKRAVRHRRTDCLAGAPSPAVIAVRSRARNAQPTAKTVHVRSRNLGKARSRLEITRSSMFGHAMTRSGSSHRTPRAASGRYVSDM